MTRLLTAGLLAAGLLGCAPFAAAASLAPQLATLAAPSKQVMPELVQRFRLDSRSMGRLYTVDNGPVLHASYKRFYDEWLAELDKLPFDSFGVDDRLDWVMLRNQIQFQQRELEAAGKRYQEAEPLVPFLRPLIDMAETRRLMKPQDGAASAAVLNKAIADVQKAQEALLAAPGYKAAKPLAPRSTASRAMLILNTAAADLKAWHDYYAGFDPIMTWWIKRPYADLEKALSAYSEKLNEHLVGKSSPTLLNVAGDPIGRDGLISALQREQIPYTPEELMALAEKELAYGEAELRRAAREMGFGDDWHAAMEKVKTLHVGPGEQTALVRRLAREADEYVTKNDLITVPELARHTWRMDMLSPEAQLASPFFLGGPTILVAYPTDTMTHDQKLMTMRGNNPHFSRAVVHHELIPGHHLQGFMEERYQPHRTLFDTPFMSEGWAVYWEFLLWDRGFAAKPEDRIGMLFWRNHRAARILFSLGFHMGKLTPEQAVDMLVKRVGHEPDNARAEVRRSFNGSYPPLYQAGYMIGALQLYALKRELVDGGKMTIKQFNDSVMQSGAMPIEILRARLKGERIPRNYTASWKFYK